MRLGPLDLVVTQTKVQLMFQKAGEGLVQVQLLQVLLQSNFRGRASLLQEQFLVHSQASRVHWPQKR